MSKPIKDGGPAFPRSSQGASCDLDMEFGMSLRDWLAGMALQGLLMKAPRGASGELCCEEAYKFADAMIAEREKGRA